MKKPLAGLLILGASAALVLPPTTAYAKHGDDDDRIDRVDDNPSGDDDGTPDQGRGDNGAGSSDDSSSDDSPSSSSDDDGTPDQGRGDNGSSSRSDDDGARAGERGRDRDKKRNGRHEVRRSGQCSDGSVWRLRLKVRDDRSRIKFQVKTATGAGRWAYTISDDGAQVAAGTRVARGRTPDFTVHVRDRSGDGDLAVTAQATNASTGETCTGSATASV